MFHVAVIPDGSGRWATARGLPRSDGHRAGVDAVRRVVAAAPDLGIGVLTVYAFSANNWDRPRDEVDALLGVLERYLRADAEDWVRRGIAGRVIGRRDRLPASLLSAAAAAEAASLGGARMQLRIAIDYSARDALVEAALRLDTRRAGGGDAEAAERFAAALGAATHQGQAGEPAPDVDLLIRTGGEQRLSDFLLWECAYAELVFTPRPWPDFREDDLAEAVGEFCTRDRRFGRAPACSGNRVS